MDLLGFAWVFALVFILNAIPAFMPPTWAVLALIYLEGGWDILSLTVMGAVASTLGRIALALWSGPLLSRFMSSTMRENGKFAHEVLKKHPITGFFFTFVYALSPFPSNSIFIVAGTAHLALLPIVVGFFIGRLASYYALLAFSAFTIETVKANVSFQDTFTLAASLGGVAVAILFFVIDWRKLAGKLPFGGRRE